MQAIEAKRKLRASEGAHFFFTLIFLAASAIIISKHSKLTCGVNMHLLVNMVFYGLTIWGTYLLITMIPRYKNPAIKIFFNFLDVCFGIYLFALFIFANVLYFSSKNDCHQKATVLDYFTQLFLFVTYFIFIILAISLVTNLLKRFNTSSVEYEENQSL